MQRNELILTDEEIKDCLHKNWKIKIHTLSYVPAGSTFGFKITLQNNSVVFLKIYKMFKAAKAIDRPNPQALPVLGHVLHKLKNIYKFDYFPRIIATHTAHWFYEMQDYCFFLFDYIEGESPTYTPNTLNMLDFAKIVAMLHQIPMQAFPELAIERFDLNYVGGLTQWLNPIHPTMDAIGLDMIMQLRAWHNNIKKGLRTLELLREHVLGLHLPFVITHGDPHYKNIMQTPQKIYLLDWDNLKIAPKERDLWFYEFGPFKAVYERHGSSPPIHSDVCRFYQVQRFFEDIRFYLEQTDCSIAQRKEYLKCFINHWGWNYCASIE
ncbi:MAG TPA: aminoglycoside phosphotransferase family protein [Gammaproteobacteria bacterium]|nr:aminoglycoside phosphotransferase family protein [Gammaproteobacteria bacterium]